MKTIVTIISCIIAVVILRRLFRRVPVLEFEKALFFKRGRLQSVLGAGQHWYCPWLSSIQKLDMRPRIVSIPNQEVLSADGVTLKVSLAAEFSIADPAQAILQSQDYEKTLYMELQLALRGIISSQPIDDVLEKRQTFSAELMEKTSNKAVQLGLNLIRVDLKDIMFPGSLKDSFAQVVTARKQGQAALEKARAETAALRNLANAAKMLEGNPHLMQLRMLQTVGDSSGNTLVLNASGQEISSKPTSASHGGQPQN